jgi:hypothetical protein
MRRDVAVLALARTCLAPDKPHVESDRLGLTGFHLLFFGAHMDRAVLGSSGCAHRAH